MRTARVLLLFGLLALGLSLLAGCENRKKRCEALYRKIAACAPADRPPSAQARLEFIQRCQKEYEGAHVKRARSCVTRHGDCAARRRCLIEGLKLDPGADARAH